MHKNYQETQIGLLVMHLLGNKVDESSKLG